jgi:hypothetical protein
VRQQTRGSLVQLRPGDGNRTDPLEGGWSARDLARRLLVDAGFMNIDDGARVVTGVEPTLTGIDRKGRRWHFEVVGGRTSNRPGAQRIELLWRAIAKASVIHETEPTSRVGVLTVGLPHSASGGSALKAVTGPKRPVAGVVDLMAADAVAQLRSLA